MVSGAGSWFDAWGEAATGPEGFWRRSVPGRHFQTSSSAGPELAEAMLTLLAEFPAIEHVVDVGAGAGQLLEHLLEASAGQTAPPLRLTGVDLRTRPASLPASVHWVQDCWEVATGRWAEGSGWRLPVDLDAPTLVVCSEWLDDLPCRIADAVPDGWTERRASGTPGLPLDVESSDWACTWWPHSTGVEVGLSRDRAWAALVDSLAAVGGIVLMIDYGHEREARPDAGSLAGYRFGRPAAPWPDPSANLTAAVAVDAVQAAGEGAGARTLWRRRQREALADLLTATSVSDPVLDLAGRSHRAALTARYGWGAHWWLLQQVEPRPV